MRPILLLGTIVLALFVMACGGSDKEGGGLLGGAKTGVQATPASGGGAVSGAGGAASTGNAASLNACTLFNKTDAAAALGKPVADGKYTASMPPLGFNLCFYGASDDRSPESVQLTVVQNTGIPQAMRQSGTTAKTLHDGLKAGHASRVAAPGIGDDAFIAGTSIYVLKGETQFSVLLIGQGRQGDTAHSNALRSAATKIVAKLP